MTEEKKTKKKHQKIQCDYRVRLYEDGKYHWMYDFSLLKNPAVLFDVFRVFGITIAIFACFLFLIQSCENGINAEDMMFVLKLTGIIAGIFVVLCLLGYLLYAALSGWVMTVHFIMDENGVEQHQTPRGEKLAQRIGCLTALVGLLARKPGVIGTGMIAASNTSMQSNYSAVRKVKAIRWMNTIKVNELFSKNRVYVDKEDFEFVYKYISSRCPKAKIS